MGNDDLFTYRTRVSRISQSAAPVVPPEESWDAIRNNLRTRIEAEAKTARAEKRRPHFTITSLDTVVARIPGSSKRVISTFLQKQTGILRTNEVLTIANTVGLPFKDMLLWVQRAAGGAHCSPGEWRKELHDAESLDNLLAMGQLRWGLLPLRIKYVKNILKNGLTTSS